MYRSRKRWECDPAYLQSNSVKVDITRCGNIYFASDTFPGCEAAKVVSDIPIELKRDVEERFTIGPIINRDPWNGKRASMAIDRGPCKFNPFIFKYD